MDIQRENRTARRLPFLVAGLWAVLAGSPSFAGDIPEIPPEEVRLSDRDAALLLRVNRAIQQGCSFLKNCQEDNGSWRAVFSGLPAKFAFPSGETALSLFVLLECGLSGKDESIEKGFEWLRPRPLARTCEAGTLLMALESKYQRGVPAQVRKALGRNARWVPTPSDLEWMKACVRFLLENRVASEWLLEGNPRRAAETPDVWGYPSKRGDPVNTLFALLGLQAGKRCGIEVPREVWDRTIRHGIEVQERDGPRVQRWELREDSKHGYVKFERMAGVFSRARGWAYKTPFLGEGAGADRNRTPTGSATCIGLLNLSIASWGMGSPLPPSLREPLDRATSDGFAWLDRHWTVDGNPCHPSNYWHLFYLACLKEASTACQQRVIGCHDWYREGAEYLVKTQREDGSWDAPGVEDPLTDTCFALLFLARETAR